MSERQNTKEFVRGTGQRVASARAFTLIELLVVVAILALLIAIMLPSLASARDSARAAVCGTRMKECTRCSIMWIIEQQRDNLSSNMGWASGALREASGETGFFTCPADTEPVPVPAFFIYMYRGYFASLYAIASVDGPFNHILQKKGVWAAYITDRIGEGDMGGNGSTGYLDPDLLFRYETPTGATSTTVKGLSSDASDNFKIVDVRRGTIFDDFKRSLGKPFAVPLLWGSYGMNASSGLRNQRTTSMLLLVEYAAWGAFSEQLGGFSPDVDSQTGEMMYVRYRHGAKQKANVGFNDGHVERLSKDKLKNPNATVWHPARPSEWRPTF